MLGSGRPGWWHVLLKLPSDACQRLEYARVVHAAALERFNATNRRPSLMVLERRAGVAGLPSGVASLRLISTSTDTPTVDASSDPARLR